jgi:succinate-semialdehyde dehydrogenase / glutarate-semialdehyde dehydrogenase
MDTIAVKNPVTSQVVTTIPVTSAQDVQHAVERARNAQEAWGALTVSDRLAIVVKWRELLLQRQNDGIEVIRQETNKVEAGAFTEMTVLDNILQYYITHAPHILKPKKRRSLFPVIHRAKVYHHPHGVVGIISPWNYPFLLPFADGIPALIAGNAVVFKPSEITPSATQFGVELLLEAGVPRDVVQVVHGDGRTGQALVDEVDYVAFTGSTATGRKIAQQAAARLIPYSLELGGKHPAIVLNDAKLDMTAADVVKAAYENTGQVCISIERVYVEEGIYDAFVEKVLFYARQLKQGSQMGRDLHLATMINQRELERTVAHVQDAKAKGATVLLGGQLRPDMGPLFMEPTVLTNVDHSMDVMTKETFGPLLPIMKVKNVDEAIRLANQSNYGLTATIYSTNFARAEALATRLHSGDVGINRAQLTMGTPSVPMGGVKDSGIGRRNGPEGLLKYTQAQSIVIDTMWGQSPELSHADKKSVFVYYKLMRPLRKWFPFI